VDSGLRLRDELQVDLNNRDAIDRALWLDRPTRKL